MGTGQHVDISIMEAVLFIQMNITSRYDYDEIITKRWGNHVDPLPGSILPCKDGYIGAITVTQEKWVTLCEWMGKPELVEDPRFKTAENRASYADDLDNILRAWLINYTEEELLKEGQKRRLPFGIPLSTEKLLKSGHLNERGYFVEVEHPATGKILYPGPQIRMGELPYELKRAPLLGEHNEEIYCGQMGFSTEDLEKMKEQGII
jgi:crotonobetainyl-CoA:carnitine CoA-transferase CaiB-like acyl-CoA transferase